MIDPAASRLFTTWTQPETGLDIHILTERVAPSQQGFYFVNDSMSGDGRYLWLYCSFPPSGSGSYGRTLAVVDAETDTIQHFPDTQFQHASPFVDPDTAEVYWTTGTSIWKRSPNPAEPAVLVNSLPEDVAKARSCGRLATHLTRSADGTRFFIDAGLGPHNILGALSIDGGEFEFWYHMDRTYNHAQFNPVDSDLVLFAQENHPDPATGLIFRITDRMWTIRRGEAPKPLFDTPTVCTHEWWDRGGKHAWCVRGKETWRTNIETGEVEVIEWPVHCWHAHDSADGRYLICDSTEKFFRGCPSSIHFHDRQAGTFLKIIDNPGVEGIAGSNYHIDPHPRFCCGGRFVVFTTTVRGQIDLAMVRTTDLKSILGS